MRWGDLRVICSLVWTPLAQVCVLLVAVDDIWDLQMRTSGEEVLLRFSKYRP